VSPSDFAGLLLIGFFIYFAALHLAFDVLRPRLGQLIEYFGYTLTPDQLSLTGIAVVTALAILVFAWIYKRFAPTYT
jgi:hypothetical protein